MPEITPQLISKLRQRTGAGLGSCRKALLDSAGDIEAAIDILRKAGIATAAKKAGRSTSEGVIMQVIAPGAQVGVIAEINCETDFVAKNAHFLAFCQYAAQAWLNNAAADLEEKRIAAIAAIGENIQLARHERLEVNGIGTIAAYIHHGAKVGVLVKVIANLAATLEKEDYKQLVKDITLQIAAGNPLAVSRDRLDATTIQREKEIAAELFKDKPTQALEKIVSGRLEKFYQTACLVDQAFVKQQDIAMADHIAQVSKSLNDTITVQQFHRYQVGETAD